MERDLQRHRSRFLEGIMGEWVSVLVTIARDHGLSVVAHSEGERGAAHCNDSTPNMEHSHAPSPAGPAEEGRSWKYYGRRSFSEALRGSKSEGRCLGPPPTFFPLRSLHFLTKSASHGFVATFNMLAPEEETIQITESMINVHETTLAVMSAFLQFILRLYNRVDKNSKVHFKCHRQCKVIHQSK